VKMKGWKSLSTPTGIQKLSLAAGSALPQNGLWATDDQLSPLQPTCLNRDRLVRRRVWVALDPIPDN